MDSDANRIAVTPDVAKHIETFTGQPLGTAAEGYPVAQAAKLDYAGRVARLQRKRQAAVTAVAQPKQARACVSLLLEDLERMPLVSNIVEVPEVRTDDGFRGFTELVRESFTTVLSQAASMKELKLRISHLEGQIAGLEGVLQALRSTKGGVP